KDDQYSFSSAENCSDQIFQQLHLLENPGRFKVTGMQINFEAAAIAQTVMNLPAARQNEVSRIGRRPILVTGRSQSRKSEALENMLWTALALSAIWALAVSGGF